MNEQTRLYETPVSAERQEAERLAGMFIPEGRANAIPRSELVRAIQADHLKVRVDDDRPARRIIQGWRDAGVVIVNAQDGRGYFRPADEDVDAVVRQLRSTHARAMSLHRQEKAQREWLRERGVEV